MNKGRRRIVVGDRLVSLPLFFLLALVSLITLPASVKGEEKVLVFGRVQRDPAKAIKDRQPFVDYIARKLAPFGITRGKILVLDKVSLLGEALKAGSVDLFHDTFVPTLILSRRAGSIPIARQWRQGLPEYHSVILVGRDSGINDLADLKGKVIAFDQPHSTSAHILPRMLLAEKKLNVVQVGSPGSVRPDVVGYIHTGDDNAAHLLISGRADAAGVSNRDYQDLAPKIQARFKIIGTTRPIPRLLISVRKDLDPKIFNGLKEILLNMDREPEGKAALKSQQGTTKIDEIPPESREMMKAIGKFLFSTFANEINSW